MRKLGLALAFILWALAPAHAQTVYNPTQGPFPILNGYSYRAQIPPDIGWDSTSYPLNPSVIFATGIPAYGSAGIAPEALFNRFSRALSAPTTTYFVAATGGNDSNDCLSVGQSCNTIGHAVQLCNATGNPCTVRVAAGQYYKGQSFTNFNTIFPTVDVAFVVFGGARANVCHCDAFSAPSKDGTYTNTYSYSLSSVERVVDLTRRDIYGDYIELTPVSTPAIANVTPNSWVLDSGTIYIQRYDGSAVLNTNTRVYRSTGAANVYLNGSVQTNLYLGGVTELDGFDVEGGSDGLKTNFTGVIPTTKQAIVVKNSSFKYGGGIANPTGNCVSIHSYNGIAAFFNVQANACAADAFNTHNDLSLTGTPQTTMLTVNSAAFDNGRYTSQSNNGFTLHEDAKGIDIAGYYWGNRGGTVRNINTSRAWLLGTVIQNDQGDIMNGGAQVPTAITTSNTAQIYLDSVQILMPAATSSIIANSGTRVLYRNMPPPRQPPSGAGMIGTY